MPLNKADVEFLKQMVPHHKLAVEMAQEVIDNGAEPAVNKLAHNVIAAQTAEITSMTAQLKTIGEMPDAKLESEEMSRFDLSASDVAGNWVTIDGAHVLIGKGGTIEKGPAHLVGQHPDAINAMRNGALGAAKAKDVVGLMKKHPGYAKLAEDPYTPKKYADHQAAHGVERRNRPNWQRVGRHLNALAAKKSGGFSRSDDPDSVKAADSIFYVLSNGEATAALTLGQAFPKQRNGLECFNYWRQAICDGEWTHPAKGFTVKVDAAQRRQWEENFRRMQRLGDEVPVVKDHKDHDADATLGYVVDVRQNGPWYEELHQYLGEKAKDTALKNKLSVGIDPDYTDVKRNKYGSAIVHSAITSRPVIPGQGDAVLAAAHDGAATERIYLTLATPTNPTGSAAAAPVVVTPSTAIPPAAPQGGRSPVMATLNCSEERLSTLRTLLPSGEALTADTAVDAVIQELQRLSADAEADAGGPEAIAKMSRADVIDTAIKNRKAVKASEQRLATDNTTLRNQVAELSRRVPKALDPEAEAAMVDAVMVKFGNATSRGAINPATRDRLLSLLVKDAAGKTNTLALSRAANPTGDRALALAIADVLQDNRPVPIGEDTGLQVLARNVPDEDSTEKASKELGKKMVDYANSLGTGGN